MEDLQDSTPYINTQLVVKIIRNLIPNRCLPSATGFESRELLPGVVDMVAWKKEIHIKFRLKKCF